MKNEDNFFFDGKILPAENSALTEILTMDRSHLQEPVCFGVFDGMGGEARGELAAYLAAKTLGERLCYPADSPEELLNDACLTANARICAMADDNGGKRMGATAAILFFTDASVWLCNIGDSRIYRLRDGMLEQLSQDHTDAAFLMQQEINNRKALLTQHLGIWPQEMLIEPYIIFEALMEGDKYLICSDGLTDMLSHDELASQLRRPEDAADMVRILISLALDRGGRDNITVILCNIR